MKEELMKRGVLFILFISILCFSRAGHGQYSFFEHKYKYELDDVLDADDFVDKENYWAGYRDGKLRGYVFLSDRWTKKLVGYSGKHMETLIGMDANGIITGVQLIFHSEPIVLIGLKENNYQEFLKQYPGNNIQKEMSVGKEISMDAITGATVTAIVQNAIIFGSARKVAEQTGMVTFSRDAGRTISGAFAPMNWKELLSSGAVKNIRIMSGDLGLQQDDIYLDLYFGVINPPSTGKNVLGETVYTETMKGLKKGETALFVVSRGSGSFKGSGFARGGIFDRFNIEQEARVNVFRDTDYRILTSISPQGSPDIEEGGIFIVRSDDFDPVNPFKFNIMLRYRVGAEKKFRSYSAEYRIPEMLLE